MLSCILPTRIGLSNHACYLNSNAQSTDCSQGLSDRAGLFHIFCRIPVNLVLAFYQQSSLAGVNAAGACWLTKGLSPQALNRNNKLNSKDGAFNE